MASVTLASARLYAPPFLSRCSGKSSSQLVASSLSYMKRLDGPPTARFISTKRALLPLRTQTSDLLSKPSSRTSLLCSTSFYKYTRALSYSNPSSSNSSPTPPRPSSQSSSNPTTDSTTSAPSTPTIRENIYTIPNALTVSRIIACPILGYSIVQGDFVLATGLLAYAGISDWFDGFIARRYNMKSVLGTILDPAADKLLMTTLTVTLAVKGLLPLALAVIILGRDVLLSLSAFYIRYKSLPAPKTFSRYWDFGIPSAEVRPTEISKINTFLQLLLMACTTVSPLLETDVQTPLMVFQWIVAGTTIWSGMGYLFSKDAVRYVATKTASTVGKGKSP